ncbi:MAG TPA: hypothetical protein VKY57_16315 [Chitinispirillaceae bacterium]|nr:hypothetical protein [Chitinispirillaceae bacterium]
MPQPKKLTKKASKSHLKCPICSSRSYKKAEKLNFIDRIRFIGCTPYRCLKCGRKFGS